MQPRPRFRLRKIPCSRFWSSSRTREAFPRTTSLRQEIARADPFLVCRKPKEELVLQGGEFQPEIAETGSMSDTEMFRLANTGGTGNMTLEELASYFGAQVDDPDLAAKFNQWVLRIPFQQNVS
jgi:hypothetical protein